ncbi:dethiobiotin synthase [Exilibacterium tricleocarpae]|uniref:ATP-dependent dethiobiotin synthetase BioD n=1 Tax=Exilibacterium tricleocarpae TaxID=2591008 RepID=A0A545T3M9_9GAMM|nr:dethiobiotin synthase [Exilibacterium tricleocarpae]TQV71833.1 dethiobiotin synthase [Exilibacterium tricleocarpae]
MAKGFFVTGTDTEVGKTFIACALLWAARQRGLTTAAVKPVAAGCAVTPAGLRNDDALQLQAAMTLDLPYEQVNPVALAPAIAPHIAAAQAGRQLDAARLTGFCRGVLTQRCDLVLVEGAGGWRVPLNRRQYLSDVARELNLGVILVVGMRLGCLNHVFLSAEAIHRDGLTLSGWVANGVTPPMAAYQDNLDTLKQSLPAPCLGEVPHLDAGRPELAADCLDIQKLLD